MAAYPERTLVTLPEPYLSAIGRVCVQWGILEQSVEKALHKFGGLDTNDWRPPVFTAHMPWPQRINVLDALVDGLVETFPQLKPYKTEVAPALKKAQGGRNRIVHAFWGYDKQTGIAQILSLTARGKLKMRIDPVTVGDINAIADDIGHAAMLLWKVVIDKL